MVDELCFWIYGLIDQKNKYRKERPECFINAMELHAQDAPNLKKIWLLVFYHKGNHCWDVREISTLSLVHTKVHNHLGVDNVRLPEILLDK